MLLTAIFQDRYQNVSILDVGAKDDEGGGECVTTGAIKQAKLQSVCHHQQTNTRFFTGQMPFLALNEQCESIEMMAHKYI